MGPWQLLAWPFAAPCPADKQNAMFTHDASSGQLKLGTVEADRVVPLPPHDPTHDRCTKHHEHATQLNQNAVRVCAVQAQFGCPDPTNCCVTAKPCVAPCSLGGWGMPFLLLFGAATALYLGGGTYYAVKVEGKERSAGLLALHPHREQWASLQSLVGAKLV